MINEGSGLSNPLFTLQRVMPEVNLIRYKEGVVINAALVEESTRVRRELDDRPTYITIVVFPSSVTFDADLFEADLHGDEHPEKMTKVLVTVMAPGPMRDMVEKYFQTFPSFFEVVFFTSLSEAMPWVEARMATRNLS